ncbi:Bro-N domain-containing protein [Candidatus Pacearchaeota archaeon]|nr:Bro-N domain-containing protein [Candidatus Pacearchaeota archaeon]
MNKKIIVFNDKNIRRVLHDGEWFFSVVDVVGVLSESVDSKDYWYRLKRRELEHGIQLSTNCRQLKLESKDGKKYMTDCANKEGILRIIQSIPSRKAEPFKLWLAKVGGERIDEIENPELAQDRAKLYYEKKGYPKDWIDKRMRGIAIRQDLTDEWKDRGVEEGQEYAILTNEISKATFDKTIGEYREIKGIQNRKENLRDYMTDWELILTMIGEKATTDITSSRNSKDFEECRESAIDGGKIAGNTRKEIEEKTGKSIVTKENFIDKAKDLLEELK